MSEPATNAPGPGVSDLLHQQVPAVELSVEQAWAKLGDLNANPDFQKRYRAGDVAARSEMAAVTKGIMGGVTIHPGQGVDPDKFGPTVAKAAAAAASLEAEQVITTLRRTADLSPEVCDMIRNNTPVKPHERQDAELERARLMKDSDFVKSWMAGNRAAMTRMALVNVILARPVIQS